MNSTERLDEIEARSSAATEGPWAMWDGWGPTHDGLMGFARLGPNAPGGLFTFPDARDLYATRADAEFIAHARTDVPALVAAIRDVLHLADVADSGLQAVPPCDIRAAFDAAIAEMSA